MERVGFQMSITYMSISWFGYFGTSRQSDKLLGTVIKETSSLDKEIFPYLNEWDCKVLQYHHQHKMPCLCPWEFEKRD